MCSRMRDEEQQIELAVMAINIEVADGTVSSTARRTWN